MAEIVIRDPVLLDTKNVDASGKIYIGKEFSGMQAKIVIEEFIEPEEEPEEGDS